MGRISQTKDHIILAGFKGCGKSTLGRELSWQLAAEFVDLDAVIEAQYAQGGQCLKFREIYRKIGAEAFRRLEGQATRALDERIDLSRELFVVALGGGALHNEQVRKIISNWGRIIFLDVPIEELIVRVKRKGFPAYVGVENAEQEFCRRFEERLPGYRQYSDLEVQLGRRSHRESVEHIIHVLQRKA